MSAAIEPGIGSRTRPLRLGILRLTDCAPLVVASELGFFEEAGLAVELRMEPSWANLADRISYGGLDGAMMLPPLALATALGLRGPPARVVVPLGLSAGGNAITMSTMLVDGLGGIAGAEMARFLAPRLSRLPRRPILGVVHRFSTHNLLLRDWLATGGIDPDRDLDIVAIPPAETAVALRDGLIDGFCSGAPWGAVAEQFGVGRTIAIGSDIWPNRPEKCLVMSPVMAEADGTVEAMIRALLQSLDFCAAPQNGDQIARLLASPDYLDVPVELIRASLPGGSGQGVDLSDFSPDRVAVPRLEDGTAFLEAMERWQLIGPVGSRGIVERVYRLEPARHLLASMQQERSGK